MTKFLIAVSADMSGNGIFGIGTTAAATLTKAYEDCYGGDRPRVVIEDGMFVAKDARGDVIERSADRDEAEGALEGHGFVARECTERMYREIEEKGAHHNSFRWTTNSAGLDDLCDDEVEQAA